MKIPTLNEELFAALCHNEADTVRKLLEGGVSPDVWFDNGLSALMVAARAGAHDVLTVLLEHGADAHALNAQGRNALFYLCNWGESSHYHVERHTESARLLLDAGADAYACDTSGDSAFWLCCRYSCANVLMLMHKRSPLPLEARHACGDTPLLMACRYVSDIQNRRCNNRHAVNLLIALGGNSSATGADGKTARQLFRNLPFACDASWSPADYVASLESPSYHWPRIKKEIRMARPLAPFAVYAHGYTDLHYAARWGDEDAARELLDAGAMVDAVAHNGLTPLMLAARCGHWRVGLLLLAHGADRHCKDCRSLSAVDYALRAGNKRLWRAM